MGVSLVNVENVEQPAYNKDDATIEALRSEIISTIKEMTQSSPIFRDQIANFSENLTARSTFSDAEHIANFAGSMSGAAKSEDLQALHEATSMEDRLHRALEVLKKELLAIQLQAKISRDVDGRIMKNQRQFFLREQLQSIRKELGYESEGKDKTIEKLVDKADALDMPKVVRKAFDDELSKLKASEQHSSETNVIRSYLEWLVSMPWGQRSQDNFDLPRADTVLEEDHYGASVVRMTSSPRDHLAGLKDVKVRRSPRS
jgi:Lon-like ATP-dependent protease